MSIYSRLINNISSEELYKGLLAHGLFSEKLPPFLTSEQFYNYSKSVNHQFAKKPNEYIYYENMRNINIPRPLGIPNPFSYQQLCKCLEDNWERLQSHFTNMTANEKHKVSRIHIRKMTHKNSLFVMNYDNYRIDGSPEEDIIIGKRYMVKADISTCFPSIYTHALAWALVGEQEAKNNQRDERLWYNQIDFYTRNTTNGETHGLLIGPHTSNLLSEIILTKIDSQLSTKWDYIRKIDDYTCYVSTYEDTQSFLLELSEQLRAYGLTLNHKKTEVVELPKAAAEQWVRRINAFSIFRDKEYLNYKEVRAYLDLAIELMQENKKNSAILNYAIKVLGKQKLTSNAKNYCVKTIFHLLLLYPYLIPLLDEYVFAPFHVSISEISDISQMIYNDGIRTQNYEATSYAVYFSLKYKFKLDNVKIEDVLKSNSCIFLLLAYLSAIHTDNRTDIKKYKEHAENLSKNESDFNRNWLFIYEVLPQSKLKNEWKNLKRKHITFIKPFDNSIS